MKIVKQEPGLVMLEQYGNVYIRYQAGEIAGYDMQIKITEDEKQQILNDKCTMEDMIYAHERTDSISYKKMCIRIIKDFLSYTYTCSQEETASIIHILQKCGKLFYEFVCVILYEHLPENGVVIEGHTAKELVEIDHMALLQAYLHMAQSYEDQQ